MGGKPRGVLLEDWVQEDALDESWGTFGVPDKELTPKERYEKECEENAKMGYPPDRPIGDDMVFNMPNNPGQGPFKTGPYQVDDNGDVLPMSRRKQGHSA